MSGSLQPAQTGSQTIAAGAGSVFPVSVGYYPREGSRCVSAQYSWVNVAGFAEDLSNLEARGMVTTVQTAYVDNSTNPQSVTLTCAGTNQVVVCPALSQGFFPLFLTGTPAVQITTAGTINAVTRVYYLNVPISASVWHV